MLRESRSSGLHPGGPERAFVQPLSASSVIVDQLHIVGVTIDPSEADPPLVVHANTVLAGPFALQFLETVPRRSAEIIQPLGGVNRDEFAEHRSMEARREAPDRLATEQPLGVPIGEASDH